METNNQSERIKKKVICFFDGACEPRNPGGNMGYGVVVVIDGEVSFKYSGYSPANHANSNNVAEYKAFEFLLDHLIQEKLLEEDIEINGDSMLVVMQMNGEWKMKGGRYMKHAISCKQKLSLHFHSTQLRIKWVGRNNNALADDLSKKEFSKHGVDMVLQKQ